jgi:acetyltransferase-like isoleucine patch superfamily enzyme
MKGDSNRHPPLHLGDGAKEAGYFAHPQALVESQHVGVGTRVWAFSHVLPGAVIGEDCNICDHVFIENDVRLGDRVTVKSGVQLWDGVTLEDDAFVGPNATFTNDPFPRSKQHLERHPRTVVQRGASVGANATILPGLTIGRDAMVGAGAVVTRNVPPNAVVVGNPAVIRAYVGSELAGIEQVPAPGAESAVAELGVRDARLLHLPIFSDLRGSLAVAELRGLVPFDVRRLFIVHDVPSREVRGEHAHREQRQFLVATHGGCSVVLDDGTTRKEILLDTPQLGLYLPAMVWATQYRFSEDAALLVLASGPYDPNDYIRDYDSFLALVQANRDNNSDV